MFVAEQLSGEHKLLLPREGPEREKVIEMLDLHDTLPIEPLTQVDLSLLNNYHAGAHGVHTGPGNNIVGGLVKLRPAVAYHFCHNLPAIFSQPRTSIISGPSIRYVREERKGIVGAYGALVYHFASSTNLY